MRYLLPFFLVACTGAPAASPRAPPLAIPALPLVASAAEVVRFGEGAAPPEGCFARARASRTFACVVGQFASRGEGERRLVLLTNPDDGSPPLYLVAREALSEPSRAALNELMARGDFVWLEGVASRLAVGTRSTFGRFSVELRPAYEQDLTLEVTSDAEPVVELEAGPLDPPPLRDRSVTNLFHNTLSDVRCEDASVAVREVEPGTFLFERECRVENQVYLAATLCSGPLGRCD